MPLYNKYSKAHSSLKNDDQLERDYCKSENTSITVPSGRGLAKKGEGGGNSIRDYGICVDVKPR